MTIQTTLKPSSLPAAAAPKGEIGALADALERDGVVRLPPLVSAAVLAEMQGAFASRLRYLGWNNVAGYARTERLRLMVEDALTLAQGFTDIAVHPLVVGVLDAYLSRPYELCEAKGWESLPTQKDFHGWHGDAWYDQSVVADRIPREVKLAFYLSDVKSGGFQYIKRTHGKQAPYLLPRSEAQKLDLTSMEDFLGPAGTAILFDTSGIHRQGIPILESRRAVFYNYHDSRVPLQKEDVDYYRYHPLLLNAAFLGGLSPEQTRVLGFGNKAQYRPGYVREPAYPYLHSMMTQAHYMRLRVGELTSNISGKFTRLLAKLR
jgi:hypothetical protein